MLDVGCGGGILADAMARKGADVLGIDLSTKALKVAQLHALEAQTADVAYREVSAEALAAEQAGSFDVVTCMEMLEHVPDPGFGRAGLRHFGQTGRLGVLLHAQPQPQILPVCHCRRRVRAQPAAARHA